MARQVTPPPSTCLTFPSGILWDLLAPRAEDVRPHDLAWHLAHTIRFGGMIRQGYSVAQHSVLTHDLVVDPRSAVGKGFDVRHQLEPLLAGRSDEDLDTVMDAIMGALIHDCPEAYLTDLIAPLKYVLRTFHEGCASPYDILEHRHEEAIYAAFKLEPLSETNSRVVHAADKVAYEIESAALRSPGNAAALALLPGGRVLPPIEAANLFLERLGRYVDGIELLDPNDPAFQEPVLEQVP